MHYTRPILSHHRLKRLAAWALLLLAWLAEALFADAPAPGRRRIRQRYAITIPRLARMARDIIIVRATQLAHREYRGQKFRPAIFSTPTGFARRRWPRGLLRAFAGGELRRRLCARDPLARIARLHIALRELEALAHAFARVVKRGLTRLCPLTPTRPPHHTPRTLSAPLACSADTS